MGEVEEVAEPLPVQFCTLFFVFPSLQQFNESVNRSEV